MDRDRTDMVLLLAAYSVLISAVVWIPVYAFSDDPSWTAFWVHVPVFDALGLTYLARRRYRRQRGQRYDDTLTSIARREIELWPERQAEWSDTTHELVRGGTVRLSKAALMAETRAALVPKPREEQLAELHKQLAEMRKEPSDGLLG